jgi:hypothetical protein
MKKTLLITTALFLGVSGAFADDFDDFGSFGDDGADSAASKLEVNGSVDTEIRAYVDTSDVEGKDGADKVEMDVTPSASIDLTYSGNKSDVSLTLKIDEDTIKNHPEDVIDEAVLRGYFGNLTLEAGKMKVVWGKGDKLHVLDNFNADDYSDFIIPDYLDRRISTPMVRAVYSLPFANMNLEGVYTPLLPVDRFATEGHWTPAQVGALTGVVTDNAKARVAASTDYLERIRMEATEASTLKALMNAGDTDALAALTAMVTKAYDDGKISYTVEEVAAVLLKQGKNPYTASDAEKLAAAKAVLAEKYEAYLTDELTAAETDYTLCLANANALSADPSVIYPDLWTLKYSQYGARVTATLGQVDLGLSYYNGWYKQPSFNASKLNTFLDAYLANGEVSEEDKFLAYDKKQTFGLEASSIIWHFNVRGEFAYNLTDDLDGTDPWVHNNSIAWLGGFDIDLPFWNANLNVQETGSLILHGDECDDFAADVDYNSKGYTNNKLVCNITTSFLNDKLAPEVTVMYGIERGDLVVMPKLAFKPDQNLTLTASGMYMHCADEDSEFYGWKKNSFASLTASYQF